MRRERVDRERARWIVDIFIRYLLRWPPAAAAVLHAEWVF